nr:unnamed protein product [Digitaria exilis]
MEEAGREKDRAVVVVVEDLGAAAKPFQSQDAAAASTKPAKRYPLALWMAILGLVMLVGVYIFSLSLKQNGMLFGLMQTNMIEKEREKPCHDPRIPDTEIPYVHYPTPKTYDSSAAKNECTAAVGLKWMLNQAEILAQYKPTIDKKMLITELKRSDKLAADAMVSFKNTKHIVLYYEDVVRNRTVSHYCFTSFCGGKNNIHFS